MKINFANLFNNVLKATKRNSPELLAAGAVGGVLVTSYLVAKASFKVKAEIEAAEYENDEEFSKKDQVRVAWKFYIPAAISGGATIACIIGGHKTSANRTAAAIAAYSLTEQAFSDYREKVVEELGKGKDQKIRDQVAQDKVLENPPGDKEVILIGGMGHVLCCELFTHRYFRSDMETLRKVQNDINAKIVNELYVTINELYDLLGLSNTSQGEWIGWNSDRLLEFVFSTVLTETGEPCLAFDYNYTKTVV